MDEEMINDEELRAAIQESLRCRSIEEALIEKEEEDKLFDESFDVLWTNYHSVSDIRRNAIRNLNRAKIRMIVLNFITAIINNNASEEVFNIIEIINNGTKELKDEKELLIRINNALEKLQAHRVSACNYDLCELLSFLYDKYSNIYMQVVEEISKATSRIKGINTMYDDKYDKAIEELNDKIDKQVLSLGLNK